MEIFPRMGATTRTGVSVVQDANGGWVVIGAAADEIIVDQPRPGDPITSALTVAGRSVAFEAQLGLQLRDGAAARNERVGENQLTALVSRVERTRCLPR